MKMEENYSKKTNEIPHVESIRTNSNDSTYQTIGEIKPAKSKSNFGKNVLLPFFSGIVGSAVVLGTCLGVPSIRNELIGYQNNNSTVKNTNTPALTGSSSSTTNLISLTNYSETGIAVANKVRPSIVGIKVEYSVNSIFYRNSGSTATAEGSGIIMSEDGYILTNNHIINSSSSSSYYELGKANKVSVFLYDDETEYEAKIIGTDKQTDLAVIKIDKTGLTAAEIGDSDSVQVGEFAMAIGNPLGMQSSVSSGIISATNRKVTTDGVTYNLIQTDAAINSGNSGGALVNAEGKVIGVNTLKLTGDNVEGMGFAIPINSTKSVYSQLVEFNSVKRPYIGITGIDLDEDTAKLNNLVVGIYVRSVEDFSSAQKADLRNGDVIIEADGKKISTMNELNEIKNTHNIGDEMTLKINRSGTEKNITLILQEQKN